MHVVALDRLLQGLDDRFSGPDVDVGGLSPGEESIHVAVDEGESVVMKPDALPDPVADEEAAVEDRNLGLAAMEKLAVDVDLHVSVSAVGNSGVRALCLRVLVHHAHGRGRRWKFACLGVAEDDHRCAERKELRHFGDGWIGDTNAAMADVLSELVGPVRSVNPDHAVAAVERLKRFGVPGQSIGERSVRTVGV